MTDTKLSSPKIPQEGQLSDSLEPSDHKPGFVSNVVFPNPIGFLNEYCQKTVTSFPKFNIINQGPIHSPTFIVKCIFKEESFEGRGLTIKKAKDNAAREAIQQLKLDKKDDDTKPSFKLVDLGDLESFWNDSESILKITIRKKEGDSQEFKSFVISKIQDS